MITNLAAGKFAFGPISYLGVFGKGANQSPFVSTRSMVAVAAGMGSRADRAGPIPRLGKDTIGVPAELPALTCTVASVRGKWLSILSVVLPTVRRAV